MNLRLGTGTNHANGSGRNNNNNNNNIPNPPIRPSRGRACPTNSTPWANSQPSNMGNAGNQAPREEHQVNKFGEFFRTNPPFFRGSKDPLDVEFWLNTIEEKLGLIQCEQHEKVLFATHQLHDALGLGGGI
jgi:hypothetical protein